MKTFSDLMKTDQQMVRELVEILWWQGINGEKKKFTERDVCKRYNLNPRSVGALKAHVARQALR